MIKCLERPEEDGKQPIFSKKNRNMQLKQAKPLRQYVDFCDSFDLSDYHFLTRYLSQQNKSWRKTPNYASIQKHYPKK